MDDSESASSEVFDVDTIRRLVELMEKHDLNGIDLRQADQRIRLSRNRAASIPPPLPPAASSGAPPPPSAAAAPGEESSPPEDPENIVTIKSPMVGTFYSRPNPNADPYVRVGDLVAPDTTVCIIEAMKVFNEIPAEVRGRVAAILVDDEEPVEFGKPLFKIDTSE